jgi:hypothetical protein
LGIKLVRAEGDSQQIHKKKDEKITVDVDYQGQSKS